MCRIVWFVAISYILCLNVFPLRTMKEYLFKTHASQLYEGYLTSVLLAWINARCVSFSLDRIWGNVEKESLLQGLLMLVAFCFYLPLGIMGPLVTSKTFKQSFSSPSSPVDKSRLKDILTQVLRYTLWFCVTDISLYFLFQQAFTLKVSKTLGSSSTGFGGGKLVMSFDTDILDFIEKLNALAMKCY